MSEYSHRDARGNEHLFETTEGSSPERELPIHDLAPDLREAVLETVTQLTAIAGYVNQLEGYTDGLEALITTTNSLVTTLSGHVDQLEGYTDGVEAKLDTLIAANDPGAGRTFQNTDIDTAGAELLHADKACALGCWVQNISSGTQKISVAYVADGDATMINGWVLSPGGEHFFPCTNANQLSVIASADNAVAGGHAI